jgi:hypothetical protein
MWLPLAVDDHVGATSPAAQVWAGTAIELVVRPAAAQAIVAAAADLRAPPGSFAIVRMTSARVSVEPHSSRAPGGC